MLLSFYAEENILCECQPAVSYMLVSYLWGLTVHNDTTTSVLKSFILYQIFVKTGNFKTTFNFQSLDI